MSATVLEPAAPSAEKSTEQPCVFVGLPHYGDVCAQALEGLMLATFGEVRWRVQPDWCSILTHNFNNLVCKCLNSRESHGWTHFGLHHADIEAEPGWIDKLLEEMDRVGADVISTVVPIKDSRGLTSTGYMEPGTGNITRFTMHEVHRLPVTFSADEACPGKWLMVNSGLWLCKLGDWIEDFPGFRFENAIQKYSDGKYRATVLSEDWHFSEWCARQGLKVYATRAVRVKHHGKTQFGNDTPWGEWLTDQGDMALENQQQIATRVDGAEVVHGWMTPAELSWLRTQAAQAHTIVEIGSWHGRSTKAMAETCPGVIYAIDHFQGSPGDVAGELSDTSKSGAEAREAFKVNLAPHLASGKVVLLEMSSRDAMIELEERGVKADMVFVDGSHDFVSVAWDITDAQEILSPGGVLCGHDVDRDGVRQAIDDRIPGWKLGAGNIWRASVPTLSNRELTEIEREFYQRHAGPR